MVELCISWGRKMTMGLVVRRHLGREQDPSLLASRLLIQMDHRWQFSSSYRPLKVFLWAASFWLASAYSDSWDNLEHMEKVIHILDASERVK